MRDCKRRLNEMELAGDEDGLAETRALELRLQLRRHTIYIAQRLANEASVRIMPFFGGWFVLARGPYVV